MTQGTVGAEPVVAREGARSKNIAYMAGVDHLRAFAALLIVFYHGAQLFYADTLSRLHLPAEPWARANNPFSALVIEGHSAVALFMVLSGFIFAYGAANSEIAYRPFIWNRFLRTYPLFLTLLLAGMCSSPNNATIEHVLSTLFGLACFNQNGAAFLPFSGMFWAISVEWQFYLAFPFLLRVLRPAPLRYGALMLAFTLSVRWLSQATGGNAHDAAYWTMLGRIDQFLVGMIAGLYLRKLPQPLLRALFAPCAIVVLGSLWQFNRWGGWPVAAPFKLIWPLWEGAMWAAFLLSYLALADRLPALLSSALCRIGTISYSIYLWHYVVLSALLSQHLLFTLPVRPYQSALLNTLLVLTPCSLALATVSYLLIEKPFFSMRVRYLRPLETAPQ